MTSRHRSSAPTTEDTLDSRYVPVQHIIDWLEARARSHEETMEATPDLEETLIWAACTYEAREIARLLRDGRTQ